MKSIFVLVLLMLPFNSTFAQLLRNSTSGADVILANQNGNAFLEPEEWASKNYNNHRWYVGDFNGDGKDDLLRKLDQYGGADIALSNESTFREFKSWGNGGFRNHRWYVGDFNGDGKDDLLRKLNQNGGADIALSNGSTFSEFKSWGNGGFRNHRWYVGDFNGDGKDDLLRIKNQNGGAEVTLSNGSTFGPLKLWTNGGFRNHRWYVGDFNGDGKDDLLRIKNQYGGAEVAFSNGSAFSEFKSWGNGGFRNHRWYVGDFNGDSKDDLLRIKNQYGGAEVAFSNGSAFSEFKSWGNGGFRNHRWYVGDFNGDGKSDLMRRGMLREARHLVYEKYREGVIKRHIGSNGRYLQFTWVREEDNVDLGVADNWAGEDRLIDVKKNKRKYTKSRYRPGEVHDALSRSWYPLAYAEDLPRQSPEESGYNALDALGFVSTKPGNNLVPLYEWTRNQLREDTREGYRDHYYSTDINSPVARHRYISQGIVAYIRKDAVSGFSPLYVGFDEIEKNHKLTTDKRNLGGLVNFQFLGYIRANKNQRFDHELKEYRIGSSTRSLRDNMYSVQLAQSDSHFLERVVVAGGGDNPLYEGGLLLATFSLEHIHGMSKHSLDYAKLLFQFIENSEEQGAGILRGENSPTGFLRRRQNPWKPVQKRAESEAGLGWAASYDELAGVLIGLQYFHRAVKGDAEYSNRVKALAHRIGQYLLDHKWNYVDSRLPVTVSAYQNDPMFTSRGVGSFAFQYPMGKVLLDITGDARYSNKSTFSSQLGFWRDALLSVEIPGEVLDNASDVLLESAGIIRYASCQLGAAVLTGCTHENDLDCGLFTNIDTHREFYRLFSANLGPIYRVNKYCLPNSTEIKFWNHALIIYPALMLLKSENIAEDVRKDMAKAYALYVYDLMERGRYEHSDAWMNALFAVLAKLSSDVINDTDQLGKAIKVSLRNRRTRLMLAGRYMRRMDEIIKYHYDFVPWQTDLPLGEPMIGSADSLLNDETLPWFVQHVPHITRDGKPAFIPPGIGTNSAWRNEKQEYEMSGRNFAYGRTTAGWFSEIGPIYTSKGAELATLESGDSDLYAGMNKADMKTYLQKYARLGFKKGSEEYEELAYRDLHMLIEAGGNDFMFIHMFLVEIGLMQAYKLKEDVKYSVLPVPGASPW